MPFGLINTLKLRLKGNLIIISGPSGVGKDTIIEKLRTINPSIETIVYYTTRKPRFSQRDGTIYSFITPEEFKTLAEQDKFLVQLSLNGNNYGVIGTELEAKRQGKDVILNITADEAVRLKKIFGKKAVLVFIDPPNTPSLSEVEKRLIARGTETAESIKTRLKYSEMQLEYAPHFDFRIVNETNRAEEAAGKILRIINSRKNKFIMIIECIQKLLRNISLYKRGLQYLLKRKFG